MGRCNCRRWGDVIVAQHPKEIRVNVSWSVVVADALSALARYGADSEPEPELALVDVARWHDGDGLLAEPPEWIVTEVREHIMYNRAAALVREIFDRCSLRKKRAWLYAEEVLEEESAAITAVADLMSWPAPESVRSVGWLLRQFERRGRQRKKGILRQLQRGSRGVRWQI